jgi:phage/conjugal plasmid C-4 type zinc finger TraR family protein
MSDDLDNAQLLEERKRTTGVALVSARLDGNGADRCVVCGDDIPPARRRAVPAAERCEPCQSRLERWRRLRGKR